MAAGNFIDESPLLLGLSCDLLAFFVTRDVSSSSFDLHLFFLKLCFGGRNGREVNRPKVKKVWRVQIQKFETVHPTLGCGAIRYRSV